MDTQVALKSMRLSHWAEVIKTCRESGLSTSQWLIQNDISKHQYYYWHRKLKEAAVINTAPSFCELKSPESSRDIISMPVSGAPILIAKDGYTIEVRDGASRDTLRMVLEVVSDVK